MLRIDHLLEVKLFLFSYYNMNKRLIPILITSISIAIIALISVQIYWINSAVTLKQDEFKRNATEALSNVVDKLEKDETLSKLRSHEEAQFLFFDEDSLTELSHTLDKLAESIGDYADDSTYEHIVFKEIQSLEPNQKNPPPPKATEKTITVNRPIVHISPFQVPDEVK